MQSIVTFQVLYRDSIDIGLLNLDHGSFPRMRDFNTDVMKSMILADSIPAKSDTTAADFGKSQVNI